MDEQTTYTDDMLRAYLNGALSEDAAARIEADVAEDEALEARLMALDPFADAVREAFAHLPSDDRTDDLLTQVERAAVPVRSPRSRRLGSLGAAAALVLAVGLGYGAASLRPQEEPKLGWRAQVALYQALYTYETVAGISVDQDQLAGQFDVASNRLGRALNPDQFADVPGMSLKRAQILAFGDKPIIQIAFAGRDGTPFAFCVIRLAEGAEPSAVRYEELAGLATSHWARDGFGYMLIGGQDQVGIEAATAHLAQVF